MALWSQVFAKLVTMNKQEIRETLHQMPLLYHEIKKGVSLWHFEDRIQGFPEKSDIVGTYQGFRDEINADFQKIEEVVQEDKELQTKLDEVLTRVQKAHEKIEIAKKQRNAEHLQKQQNDDPSQPQINLTSSTKCCANCNCS